MTEVALEKGKFQPFSDLDLSFKNQLSYEQDSSPTNYSTSHGHFYFSNFCDIHDSRYLDHTGRGVAHDKG